VREPVTRPGKSQDHDVAAVPRAPVSVVRMVRAAGAPYEPGGTSMTTSLFLCDPYFRVTAVDTPTDTPLAFECQALL